MPGSRGSQESALLFSLGLLGKGLHALDERLGIKLDFLTGGFHGAQAVVGKEKPLGLGNPGMIEGAYCRRADNLRNPVGEFLRTKEPQCPGSSRINP